jgi:hypothetical protein
MIPTMTPREAKKRLNQILTDEAWRKHPNHRRDLTMPIKHYEVTKANGLTQAVIAVIRCTGYQAERINTTGRQIDNRKEFTDVVGIRRTVGSLTWIPGTGTKGSADIHASIPVNGSNGFAVSVKIEIKINDKQSEYQKEYQKTIENSGGIYLIIHSLQEFFNWWDNFVKPM